VHSVDDGFHLVGGVSAASFDLGGILSSRRLAVGAPRGPHTFNLPLLFIYGGGGRSVVCPADDQLTFLQTQQQPLLQFHRCARKPE